MLSDANGIVPRVRKDGRITWLIISRGEPYETLSVTKGEERTGGFPRS